jgi:hemerythrin-like domain-containing protein
MMPDDDPAVEATDNPDEDALDPLEEQIEQTRMELEGVKVLLDETRNVVGQEQETLRLAFSALEDELARLKSFQNDLSYKLKGHGVHLSKEDAEVFTRMKEAFLKKEKRTRKKSKAAATPK